MNRQTPSCRPTTAPDSSTIGPGDRFDAVPLEEGAIVPTGEEAGLLALRPTRDVQPGAAASARTSSFVGVAERERDPVEELRVDGGEHVRLVLPRIRGARDEPQAVALDDSRVVPRPEHVGAGTLGERRRAPRSGTTPLQRMHGFGVRPAA